MRTIFDAMWPLRFIKKDLNGCRILARIGVSICSDKAAVVHPVLIKKSAAAALANLYKLAILDCRLFLVGVDRRD